MVFKFCTFVIILFVTKARSAESDMKNQTDEATSNNTESATNDILYVYPQPTILKEDNVFVIYAEKIETTTLLINTTSDEITDLLNSSTEFSNKTDVQEIEEIDLHENSTENVNYTEEISVSEVVNKTEEKDNNPQEKFNENLSAGTNDTEMKYEITTSTPKHTTVKENKKVNTDNERNHFRMRNKFYEKSKHRRITEKVSKTTRTPIENEKLTVKNEPINTDINKIVNNAIKNDYQKDQKQEADIYEAEGSEKVASVTFNNDRHLDIIPFTLEDAIIPHSTFQKVDKHTEEVPLESTVSYKYAKLNKTNKFKKKNYLKNVPEFKQLNGNNIHTEAKSTTGSKETSMGTNENDHSLLSIWSGYLSKGEPMIRLTTQNSDPSVIPESTLLIVGPIPKKYEFRSKSTPYS